MYKSEFLLKNETYKILLNFEIQTVLPIQARIPVLVLINKEKRTYHQVDLPLQ